MATKKTTHVQALGTGRDPLDRFPAGALVTVTEAIYDEGREQNWLLPVEPDAAEQTSPGEAEYVQQYDDQGRVRLGRKLDAVEAAQMDAEHRRAFIESRTNRFAADEPEPGTPYEP